MTCEKNLNTYFRLQKVVNFGNEPDEIKNYKKTFNRVNRLEEKLNIIPQCLIKLRNKKKEERKKKEKNEKKNKEKNDIKNEEENIMEKDKNNKNSKQKKKKQLNPENIYK